MKSKDSTQLPLTPGDRLKALRKANHVSQQRLSEVLDCHKNTISTWENGKPIAETFYIVRMANFFGVSADYLMGLSPVPTRADMPAPPPPEPPATAAGRKFDELAHRVAEKFPDALLLFARPFSDAELEMLTGAFRSVAAHREEVAAEVDAARKVVPIADDPPLGLANGQDHVG